MDARNYIMLVNHLQYNFYPPIYSQFVIRECEKVIERVNNGSRSEGDIDVIELFHLEFFVQDSLLTEE